MSKSLIWQKKWRLTGRKKDAPNRAETFHDCQMMLDHKAAWEHEGYKTRVTVLKIINWRR